MILWNQSADGLPSITEHQRLLRKLACVVSGYRPVTLHHCHSGSMTITPFGSPGVARKQLDALQIPLAAEWHVGRFAIDGRVNGGVNQWEGQWGSQVSHLNSICEILGYSVWRLAYEEASELIKNRVDTFYEAQPSLFLHLPTHIGGHA